MASYVNYEYYKSIYGEDAISEPDFNRLSWEACRRIDILTLNKLKFAFPTNEDDAETVRRCVCMIISDLQSSGQIKKAAMESVGYTQQEDGSVRGKVITSVSSGSESMGFSAGGSSTKTAHTKMAEGEKELSEEVISKVKRLLSFVPDANGVNLLYAGAYPKRI